MNSTNVLFIEDYENFRTVVIEILKLDETIGTIYEAPTLDDGLIILDKNLIDVIVLDLCLPDANGVEGIEKIICLYPEIPIIILTSIELSRKIIDSLIIAGAYSFISKSQLFKLSLSDSIRNAACFRNMQLLVSGAR